MTLCYQRQSWMASEEQKSTKSSPDAFMMNQHRSLKVKIAETMAVSFEVMLGLVVAIISTQCFPRQHGEPKEPCCVRFEVFLFAAIFLSLGLPWVHSILRRWSNIQRLIGFILALVAFAFLFFGLGWGDVLRSSWEKAW